DANCLRYSAQGVCGVGCFRAARFIIVFEDKDVATGERVDAVVGPVAARDRGRAVIERSDAIRVLLAFANEDTCVWVLQQVPTSGKQRGGNPSRSKSSRLYRQVVVGERSSARSEAPGRAGRLCYRCSRRSRRSCRSVSAAQF